MILRGKKLYAIRDVNDDGYLMVNRNDMILTAMFPSREEAEKCLNKLFIDDDLTWEWVGEKPMPEYEIKTVMVLEDFEEVEDFSNDEYDERAY